MLHFGEELVDAANYVKYCPSNYLKNLTTFPTSLCKYLNRVDETFGKPLVLWNSKAFIHFFHHFGSLESSTPRPSRLDSSQAP